MAFRTRKFAARLLPPENTTKLAQFNRYNTCLNRIRALKNYIIPKIIALSSVNDFEYSGNQAAKRLYDRIKIRVFFNLPVACEGFKERLRRNVFFEVYDLIRNEWVRYGFFTQMITFLEAQPHSVQIDFLMNRLDRPIQQALIESLAHRFTGRSPRFTKAFLTNMLQALRKQALNNPRFAAALWQFIQQMCMDPAYQAAYCALMQTGWTKQENRKKIKIQPADLLGVLQHRFKIATSRLISRRYSNNPLKKAERDHLMTGIQGFGWDLNQLCIEAYLAEMNEWTGANCVTRLTKSSFASIKVRELSTSAFHTYILTKLRYQLRNQLSCHETDSILHHFLQRSGNSAPRHQMTAIWADLMQIFQSPPTSPAIRSKTIAIKFTEQLYTVSPTNHPDNPIQIRFTPYPRHPGFYFGVSQKTLNRLAPLFPLNADPSSFFATVPVLQLDGFKIIVNQPIPRASVDTSPRSPGSDSSVVRGMRISG